MAEPHVGSALVAKRGELAGEVQRCRRELRELDEQLGHLDAAESKSRTSRGCVPRSGWRKAAEKNSTAVRPRGSTEPFSRIPGANLGTGSAEFRGRVGAPPAIR